MPRPGSPQQPRFQRGQELAYGDATAANDLGDMADSAPAPMVTSEDQFMPQTPEDQFLYAGTDKPDEPITAGAPFGAGPMVRSFETTNQFMRRISSRVANGVPAEVKAFLDRAAAGE